MTHSKLDRTGPLSGIKILDLTTVVLGPYATQILGDMGAEVIKVEGPEGDIFRYGGAKKVNRDMGPMFLTLNRNKRSLVLDLKQDTAKDILRKLITDSDVLIHNIRMAGMDRLGFGYDAVKSINPKILYVHACGYSKDGPYAGRQAYDDLVQAASGNAELMSLYDGQEEFRFMPSLLADKTTGLHAVYATLAGLLHRERTGEGQFIEVPMLESMVSFTLAEHQYGHVWEPPLGQWGYVRVLSHNRRPHKTEDGYVGIMPYRDEQWQQFFELAGCPEVMQDERFATYEARTENVDDLYGEMSRAAGSKTTEEWLDLLDKANIPAMRVNRLQDLPDDPHLKATGFFGHADHPSEGAYRPMAHPVKFTDSPTDLKYHAPRLGEHSRAILENLGYSKEEIQALVENGTIGIPNSS